MSKQYTFKTTKDTEWMEEILNRISPQDRSAFIRDSIRQNLEKLGVCKDILGQTSDKVTHQTSHVIPKRQTYKTIDFVPGSSIIYANRENDSPVVFDDKVGGFTPRTKVTIPEPAIFETTKDEPSIDDLEAKMSSLYK